AGALAVEADRKPARLPHGADELAGARGIERARRIVQQHTRRAELRQPPRLLDERVSVARPAGAVEEAGVELAVGSGDGSRRLAEVRDVVQRVVETEDVDPALRSRRDEPSREIGPGRA